VFLSQIIKNAREIHGVFSDYDFRFKVMKSKNKLSELLIL